jgi:hypothetical protein
LGGNIALILSYEFVCASFVQIMRPWTAQPHSTAVQPEL